MGTTILDKKLTDKWNKVELSLCDDAYVYENYDYFWEWIYFWFWGSLSYATSKKFENTPSDVFEIILWIYEFDREYDGDGRQKEYKDRAEQLQKEYYIYNINTREHGNFAFDLWKWELRGGDGIMLLDKKLFDNWTDQKANKFLEEDFTEFFNWRMYDVSILTPHKWKDGNWNEMETWDYADGFWPCFSRDINELYHSEFEETYWKLETDF